MIFPIILGILKIIGITLLCILGLALLLILIVLFVPIRYKVTADVNINDGQKDYNINAGFSWLLCLVRGKYEYPSEEGFVVKVGPFTIYGNEKKDKEPAKEKKKKSKNSKETPRQIAEEKYDEESVKISIKEKDTDVVFENDDMSSNKEYDVLEDMLQEDEEKKANSKPLKEKILYTWQKICDKINKIRQKIQDVIKNIKKYSSIIKSEEFQSAFGLCKESIVKFFIMIKPRKVRINGTVGLKNPEQTGYMCAVVGMVSPFFKNGIQITPDFEQFIIDGKVLIKGRIFLFVLLIIGIKAFFDKNIRKVIEMFRKEEL